MSGSNKLARAARPTIADHHLTDRYVDAVRHALPPSRREEAEIDLRRRIGERVLRSPHPAAAEHQAIAALGDPLVQAANYASQPLYLIGPMVFPQYLRLLRVLVVAVPTTVATVVAVVQGFAGEQLGSIAAETVALLVGLAVQVVFWTTLVFAIVERVRPDRDTPLNPWTPADLPEPSADRISLGDTVAAVVMLAVLMVFLLGQTGASAWPLSQLVMADGNPIPLLTSTAQPWVTVLVGVLGVALLLELVRFAVGEWTTVQATLNTLVNLTLAGLSSWLLITQPLINPDYVAALGAPGAAAPGSPGLTGLAVIVIIVCTYDTVVGWWRALR